MRVITAVTLDDTQLERIIKAADPKAVIFDAETVETEGIAVEVRRLRKEWADLRNQLLYFEALHQEDMQRREAPAQPRDRRAQIAAKAKELASLVADDPGLAHHCDALSRLITGASSSPTENPELDKRDKGSAFNVTICDRLAPAFREFFKGGRYSTNPTTGDVTGPFVCFALAVCRELDIRKKDGAPPDAKAIKAALGYKTRRKISVS
jgi:hypothetical protein